jgi:hypothetical protein
VSPTAERQHSNVKRSAKHLIPNNLVLRCVVFRNDQDEFTAECIDLDLIAYGKTQCDALHSLRDAMIGYLGLAFEGDHSGLVPRPSPLSHRARYHLFALRAALNIRVAGAKRNFLLSDWSPSLSACKAH